MTVMDMMRGNIFQGGIYIVVGLKDMRNNVVWWKGNFGRYMTSIGIDKLYISAKGGGDNNVDRIEIEWVMTRSGEQSLGYSTVNI